MYAKLKPIVTSKSAGRSSKLPRPPQTTADLLASRRAYARNKAIASETRASIEAFEATMRDRMAMEQIPGSGEGLTVTSPKPGENAEMSSPTALVVSAFLCIQDLSSSYQNLQTLNLGETANYVSKIKRRVQDNLSEREERDKRRRRVLVEQMTAMHQQEVVSYSTHMLYTVLACSIFLELLLFFHQEERREKMLVERLMRQCQQERRIATQLMQIRREKDTIRSNRIFRQQQQEEMRIREFQEALEREAVCP